MLSGVLFSASGPNETPVASFVNKFVLTDILLASSPTSAAPPLPSIATLLGPLSQLPALLGSISRAFVLAGLSRLTGVPIERISVANTNVLFHDGRALATCESGPPAWVELPSLDTVGWWDLAGDLPDQVGLRELGGTLGWIREWTTAHVSLNASLLFPAQRQTNPNPSLQPKTDPVTKELILFHSSILPPYLHYSVIPSSTQKATTPRILSAPVPISSAKMMHDMAASRNYSILLDIPLSLDPLNLARGIPVVSFSPTVPARFGVLPRHDPTAVKWFSAPPCVIFHTAIAYDTPSDVHLLCCRLNSSRLIYEAGNLEIPQSQLLPPGKEESCQLYYYRFPLHDSKSSLSPSVAFPLSVIPFEFPATPVALSMSGEAKFVYGCSMKFGNFGAALGSAAKINCLVKVNFEALVAKGCAQGNKDDEPVDSRPMMQIIEEQKKRVGDEEESEVIRVFTLPEGYFGQECSFVPRATSRGPDDGFLLMYVFNEAQLDEFGDPIPSAKSELWIVDAWTMHDVVAKVQLPQRGSLPFHLSLCSSCHLCS